MVAIYGLFPSHTSILIAGGITFVLSLILSQLLHKQVARVEKHFIDNVNVRENTRTGKERGLVSDLHLASIRVGYGCPFVGEKLKTPNSVRNTASTL